MQMVTAVCLLQFLFIPAYSDTSYTCTLYTYTHYVLQLKSAHEELNKRIYEHDKPENQKKELTLIVSVHTCTACSVLLQTKKPMITPHYAVA